MPTNRTYGMEIEIPYVGKRVAYDFFSQLTLPFELHDDGSIRYESYTLGDVPIIPMTTDNGETIVPFGAKRAASGYGCEVVTKPLNYDSLYAACSEIGSLLKYVKKTPKSSIHVHVDIMDEPWRNIQKLILLFMKLEAVIYRLAALGGEHRGCREFVGEYLDHKYARPLSNSIGIRRGNRSVPLIDTKLLIKANTASEIAAAWGRLDLSWNNSMPKYVPHRLSGLNIKPILHQSTIEWRVWDGEISQLGTVIKFVHEFHNIASQMSLQDIRGLRDLHLGSAPKDFNVKNLEEMGFSNYSEIWNKTNWLKSCRSNNPPSHYRDEGYESPSIESVPIVKITNNCGKKDDGSDEWCFATSNIRYGRGVRRSSSDE